MGDGGLCVDYCSAAPKLASVYKVVFLLVFHFIDQLSALQQLITSMLMRKTNIETCYRAADALPMRYP
jgi:hypothetical protein